MALSKVKMTILVVLTGIVTTSTFASVGSNTTISLPASSTLSVINHTIDTNGVQPGVVDSSAQQQLASQTSSTVSAPVKTCVTTYVHGVASNSCDNTATTAQSATQ